LPLGVPEKGALNAYSIGNIERTSIRFALTDDGVTGPMDSSLELPPPPPPPQADRRSANRGAK